MGKGMIRNDKQLVDCIEGKKSAETEQLLIKVPYLYWVDSVLYVHRRPCCDYLFERQPVS